MENVISGASRLAASGCAAPCAGGGDFWHIATAHIVCNQGKALTDIKLFCLIGADVRGETRYIKFDRLRLLFEYFRHIGMHCLLVKFDIGTGQKDTHISYEDKLLAAMDRVSPKQYECALNQQAAVAGSDWQQLWSQTPPLSMINKTTPIVPIAPVAAMLSLHRMTTIVANYIHLDLTEAERQQRFALVRRYLSGPADVTQSFERHAEKKLYDLLRLVSAARTKHNLPDSRAVLIMYRKGTVNFRQDSTTAVTEQIQQAAFSKGLVTIRVAVGLSKEELAPDDFDLFNVRDTDEFVDKAYLARLWAKIYNTKEIFGVVGPRTGSLDVAAFQGVNVFCYDEPILEIIAGDRHPSLRRLYSPLYAREQLWQQLLLFQMCGIHNITELDPTSYDETIDRFCRIRPEPLAAWLAGGKCVPEIPCTREAVKVVDYWCQERLENQTIGLKSYNIRKLLDRVIQELKKTQPRKQIAKL
ncbi:hypothetical protein BKA63DRAFT_90520 [Paraphoma chrysanthemicola]|nr:hypothetical protein BKA63DRAFT_90520 [Paraphoma chrysanthemicola]